MYTGLTHVTRRYRFWNSTGSSGRLLPGSVEKILNFPTRIPRYAQIFMLFKWILFCPMFGNRKQNNYEDHINKGPWGIGLPYGHTANSLTVAI